MKKKQKTKPKKKWRDKFRRQTVTRKRKERKGKISYYKLFGKGAAKYGRQIYAASISIINPFKGPNALDKWADRLEQSGMVKGLAKLIGRKKPSKCTIIVAQRNRVKPYQIVYTSYLAGVAMRITEKNTKAFAVGVIRGHGENIRQGIVRRGYRQKKYDEGNFKPWHVPYIDITVHYKIKK